MTVTVANTANTNTFDYWRNRTNELAYAMTTQAVTVNSNIAVGNAGISGSFSFGNSSANSIVSPSSISVSNTITSVSVNLSNIIIGNASSNVTVNTTSVSILNTLLSNSSLKIGTATVNAVINSSALAISNSTANINITVPNTAQISGGNYYLNANGSWAGVSSSSSNGSITTSSTSVATLDSFAISSYYGAEYLVQANNSSGYHLTKLLVMHDGVTGYITEYGTILSSSSLGTFSATISSGNVAVQFTPAASTTTTVRYVRTIL